MLCCVPSQRYSKEQTTVKIIRHTKLDRDSSWASSSRTPHLTGSPVSAADIMSCLEWFVILVTAARDTHSPPDVFDFPIKRNHTGMSYFRVISSNECTLCDACRRRRAVALLCSLVSCKHKRFRRFLWYYICLPWSVLNRANHPPTRCRWNLLCKPTGV